ncbi:MAG: hypothetical protein WDN27_01885 [Candidatus Saccharibacteria bacterium]
MSLLNYHQFPWWNPWEAGGTPLYANPQLGVFSIQTVFVCIFGVVRGLKYSLIIYTFLGYGSMYVLLRKYFKIEAWVATLLGLLWIFSSFFVFHIPSHYTFVWYMMAPFFLYLALTLDSVRKGIYFGLAFAIMGLSQIHNAFFQIGLVCIITLLVRLIRMRRSRRQFLLGIAAGAGVFLLLAGHRLLFTIQNVHDFSREIADPAPSVLKSAVAILLPYPRQHPLPEITLPTNVPFGWGEMTATIGICATLAAFLSLLFIIFQSHHSWRLYVKKFALPNIVLLIGLFVFLLGCGAFSRYAPYNLLKHTPVFGQMRVSSRWFLGVDLMLLIFIGLVMKTAPQRSFYRFTIRALLVMGVAETFLLNFGYQNILFAHQIVVAPKPITAYTFEQTGYFGETRNLPRGQVIPDDGHMPQFYREYEATTFNTGVLYANDSLVNLGAEPSPRCSTADGCKFVQSGNAVVTYWSPDKIVLRRTKPGRIELDMNNSNYFVINGHRNSSIRVAEPYEPFYLPVSESTTVVTLEVKPSLTKPL